MTRYVDVEFRCARCGNRVWRTPEAVRHMRATGTCRCECGSTSLEPVSEEARRETDR